MRIFILITILSLLNSPIILSSPQSILLPRGSPLPSCPTPDPTLNYRPVIGILTHPGDGASGRLDNRTGVTNIPASYVKFVESAGARVVPLIHTDPWETILDKLNLVNGVLFTGGWAKKGLYFETAKKIFQVVLERNDAGEHFPLFGICLGFEVISMIVAEDHDILERFSGEDQASTLQFTNLADMQGSVFERFPPELLNKLSTECIAMQNHMFGLSPRRLQENVALSSFFKILTTTPDEDGKLYISTAQGINYPVTCFQWHPEKLNLVNGVLFTGGWAKYGLYFETAKKIFQVVLERNDAGEHFPLFGICLGFEVISMIVAEDHDILERFSGEDQASTLQFTNLSDMQGSVFERFPPELLNKLSTECIAMENHMFGLSPRRLQENIALSCFFKILTTTPDEDGKLYISTAQGINYPVTCFQWHPEKNAFEWGSSKIPHSEDAVQVTQQVANYFIREARKSSNRPPPQEVLDNLIYNYPPTYGGKAGKGYDEVYLFS